MRDVTRRAARLLPDLRGPWLAGVLVLASLPVLRMAWWVRTGDPLQTGDYWFVIDANVSEDGWLRPGRFLEFDNAHLLAVPKVLYWVNARLLGGSNITLGYAVVAAAVAQVGILWALLPRRDALTRWQTAAAAVAIPALLFAPHGTWNFLRSMSGAAWLTANLLIVVAIAAAWRGWEVPAAVAAVVAAVTYGTGLTAWLAVVVVVLLRDRRIRGHLPLLAGAGITYVAYYLSYEPPTDVTSSRPGPLSALENAATVVGSIISDDVGVARWVGGAGLLALVVVAVICVARDVPGSVPWVGLAVSAAAATSLIALERNLLGDALAHGRYSSVAALTWASLLVLGSLVVRPRLSWIAVVVAVGVAASLNTSSVGPLRERTPLHEELEVALRLGVEGGGPWLLFEPFPEVSPRLRAIGHYPFHDSYDGDCGLLGTTIDPADQPASGEGGVTVALTKAGPHGSLAGTLGLSGSIEHPGLPVRCIVVTDGDDRVVGVGWDGREEPLEGGDRRVRTSYAALAAGGDGRHRVWIRFEGSERLHPSAPVPSG